MDGGAWHPTAGSFTLPHRSRGRRRRFRCAIVTRLSVNRNTVILWRKRIAEDGLDSFWDIAPDRGRKPTYQIDKIAAIVEATLQAKPDGMTHWSCRTLAQSQGVSKSTVNNIWRAPTICSPIVPRLSSSPAIRNFWKK